MSASTGRIVHYFGTLADPLVGADPGPWPAIITRVVSRGNCDLIVFFNTGPVPRLSVPIGSSRQGGTYHFPVNYDEGS